MGNFRFYAFVALVATVFVVPAAEAKQAEKLDLGAVTAQKEVKDTILHRAPSIKLRKPPVARAALTDNAGNTITVDSTVPGYDINQVAAVINSTIHGAEVSNLVIHVQTMAQIGITCGSPDAIACYLALNPTEDGSGEIWFAADDPDWIHSLVHEYGHHTDNQLLNLSHLSPWGIGQGCGANGDGSRDWFFARQLEDRILDNGFNCDPSSEWELLLPELYAEDFVALNGINAWQLSSARSPTSSQLNALRRDIEHGLYGGVTKFKRYIKRGHMRFKKIKTRNWNFLRVSVRGAAGRDFDIYLYEYNRQRYTARSIKGGRTEVMKLFIGPGKWEIGISAYRKSGTARVNLALL